MSSNNKATRQPCPVVLDGMHDDTATRCWMRLLRYGVVFRIEASADEVRTTPIHQKWQEIIGTGDIPALSPGDRTERWDQLCDLLIETCLPVLQRLAPEVPRESCDRSLRGCFHAATYHLQLTEDPSSRDVSASVTSGPVDGSPYGFQPDMAGEIDALGAGLPRYSSRDVQIVETEAGLSMGPRRVRTPDGLVHGFKACVQDSKILGTDHIINHSRDAICAYLQLHKSLLQIPGLPSVSGVVVDNGAFTGILLQDIQASGNLASRLDAITSIEGLERIRQIAPEWQVRISSVVSKSSCHLTCY